MKAAKENAPSGDGRAGREARNNNSKNTESGHETHGANRAAELTSAEPSFTAMREYVECGYPLILLERRGKRPLSREWTTADTNSAGVLEEARQRGLNVGVRLRPTDLVIDADPRNYPDGRDCLAEFARDVGIDLDNCPHVLTGGNGHHYYMKKPADLAILGSLGKYPGVEFKTAGQQVVAAGSVHPSGRIYESELFYVGLKNTPHAPEALRELIRRPARPDESATERWGELTPDMLASNLEQLDPCDFRDEEQWRNLMMSCHHATAGEGREEFIEWSTGDPEYADHHEIIGRRWDSLHSTYRGGRSITVAYLYKQLGERGIAPLDRRDPEDDFEVVVADEAPLPTLRRMKNGKPESTFPNCLRLVRHLDSQLGLIYDEFGCATHLLSDSLPWSVDVGRRLTDDVVRQIRQCLVEACDVNWSKDDVCEAVLTVAREKTIHPVRDYLAGLTWDGRPRLDSLLVRYAGAADNAYARAIGAKTLIAAVRRVRQPGCKFDNVIVLEGDQGCGKSSFVKSLCPAVEWFSDSPIGNTESKDAPLSLQGRWIIELGEMSVLSKSGVEALKQFVSSSIDHVRRPYGRMHEELRRQCIFIGTTNQSAYLKDQTGNRRFWPVRVGAIDLDALIADRDQLWAEAAMREAAGEAIVLPRELWEFAAIEQEERVSDDPWVDTLRAYLDGRPGENGVGPTERVDRVHSVTLLTSALGVRVSDQTPAHMQRLKIVMEKHLGWKHKANLRVGDDAKQGKGYVRL